MSCKTFDEYFASYISRLRIMVQFALGVHYPFCVLCKPRLVKAACVNGLSF